MPFYTYVVSYRGATYVDQVRSSNIKGHGPGFVGAMLAKPEAHFSPKMINETVGKAYYTEWTPVPNRINLWRASFDLEGSEFLIHVIQTQP